MRIFKKTAVSLILISICISACACSNQNISPSDTSVENQNSEYKDVELIPSLDANGDYVYVTSEKDENKDENNIIYNQSDEIKKENKFKLIEVYKKAFDSTFNHTKKINADFAKVQINKDSLYGLSFREKNELCKWINKTYNLSVDKTKKKDNMDSDDAFYFSVNKILNGSDNVVIETKKLSKSSGNILCRFVVTKTDDKYDITGGAYAMS